MCEQGTLVVAFHTSSVHKTMYQGDEWHVATPLPKGRSHRVANFHTPFRHGISPTPHHYIVRTEHQECSYFQVQCDLDQKCNQQEYVTLPLEK